MKIIGKLIIFLNLFSFGFSESSSYVEGDRYSFRKLLTDWCSFKCGKDHVVCQMGGHCRPKSSCILDAIDKEKILQTHNELRNRFAGGNDSHAPGITASNMVALTWDYGLAYTASCNVAKCGKMEHDKCHTTHEFSSAGQNLWSFGSSKAGDNCVKESISGVKKAWYDEIKKSSPEEIKSNSEKFRSSKEHTGHFTQLIWAKTTHVGCALTKNGASGHTKCMMACNYGPAGNVNGRSMFKEGPPCSECPKGLTCGSTFESLCGEGGVGPDDGKYGDSVNLRPNFGVTMLFVLICVAFVK